MIYTIQEVAHMLGIKANRIRFYEKKGLIKPKRENNDYRVFDEDDIILLQTILLYREIGITVKDIEGLLKDESKQTYLQHFYKQWEIINHEMHRFEAVRKTLENLMDKAYELNEKEFKQQALGIIEDSKQKEFIRNNWKDQWDFNNWAKNYDRDIRKSLGSVAIYKNYDQLLHTVVDQTIRLVEPKSKVLDIGIGTGNLSQMLYEKGYHPVGVDQSRAMLEVTKTKNPNIKVRIGDFMRLPFEANQFNAIVSTYAFHHLNDREKEMAIDEMIRVVGAEGIIIIGDMMFACEQSRRAMYNTLSNEQIEEIEDEYYTHIDHIAEYVKKHKKKVFYEQADEFCWCIVIQ